MPCHWIKLPGGGVAIVKMAAPRRKRCACGAWSTRLCDHDMGNGKTCDKPMCERCAKRIGPNLDLCKEHAGSGQQR